MTDTDTAELERQAEEARVRLSDTADKLRARMSPGQLMDELMGQFRDGDSGAMLANLRTQVRDNPMALALIGSGVAWLLAGNGAAAPAKSSGSAADLGAFTSVSGDRAPLRSAAEPDTSGGEAGSGPQPRRARPSGAGSRPPVTWRATPRPRAQRPRAK